MAIWGLLIDLAASVLIVNGANAADLSLSKWRERHVEAYRHEVKSRYCNELAALHFNFSDGAAAIEQKLIGNRDDEQKKLQIEAAKNEYFSRIEEIARQKGCLDGMTQREKNGEFPAPWPNWVGSATVL